MYDITIIGFHVEQYRVTLTLTLCCYKEKLSDLEITNRLLIANTCTSALCQYFSVIIIEISDFKKYFELGLITPKKQNIGY